MAYLWRRQAGGAQSLAPGAILGQQCFRHKTQKQPFRTRFFISVALNVAALAGLYVVYTHLLSR